MVRPTAPAIVDLRLLCTLAVIVLCVVRGVVAVWLVLWCIHAGLRRIGCCALALAPCPLPCSVCLWVRLSPTCLPGCCWGAFWRCVGCLDDWRCCGRRLWRRVNNARPFVRLSWPVPGAA